jgi:HSP20 family protein
VDRTLFALLARIADMRRNNRDDDPFSDFFRELERMMEEMSGNGVTMDETGFGTDAHFSIYEEPEALRVVGDLPGLSKEDIEIKCDGSRVTIAAGTDRQSYEERIELPGHVDEHSARATFKNGILEVELDRTDSSQHVDIG